MADNAAQGQRILRRIAVQNVDLFVLQVGQRFEIEATRNGQTVSLKGTNLVTLAKDLAKRLGVDPQYHRR